MLNFVLIGINCINFKWFNSVIFKWKWIWLMINVGFWMCFVVYWDKVMGVCFYFRCLYLVKVFVVSFNYFSYFELVCVEVY